MSTFSLDHYQKALSEINDEVRNYGSVRGALELSVKALDSLSSAVEDLNTEQGALGNKVAENSSRLMATLEQSRTLVDKVDVLGQKSVEKDTFQQFVSSTESDFAEVSELLTKANSSLESLQSWSAESSKLLNHILVVGYAGIGVASVSIVLLIVLLMR